MNSVASLPKTTHVIVVGNEKGGSGKSTTAMHLAVALLLEGMRVATIDLDCRQQTLTQYIKNRRRWADLKSLYLPTPEHHVLERSEDDSVRTNTWSDYEAFSRLMGSLEERVDFIIIDTPGFDTSLSRMAHSVADTLLTPMNDSFIDLDVIAHVAQGTNIVSGISHYAEMVLAAREERAAVDSMPMDWVIVRNRLSSLESRNGRAVSETLTRLSGDMSFRVAEGISERIVFREYFTMGMTALDSIETFHPDNRPTVSHMAGRNEVLQLVQMLKLPMNDRSRRRKAAHHIWHQNASMPLELTEILA